MDRGNSTVDRAEKSSMWKVEAEQEKVEKAKYAKWSAERRDGMQGRVDEDKDSEWRIDEWNRQGLGDMDDVR